MIFVYSPYFLATTPRQISFSGVISPPGTRGMTLYRPPRCMLAKNLSLVSCSVWWLGSVRLSFHSEAKIEAAAGLQISQP